MRVTCTDPRFSTTGRMITAHYKCYYACTCYHFVDCAASLTSMPSGLQSWHSVLSGAKLRLALRTLQFYDIWATALAFSTISRRSHLALRTLIQFCAVWAATLAFNTIWRKSYLALKSLYSILCHLGYHPGIHYHLAQNFAWH